MKIISKIVSLKKQTKKKFISLKLGVKKKLKTEKFLISSNNVETNLQKLNQFEENYVFFSVKIKIKSLNKIFIYIKYSQLKIQYTNYLCKLAGYENIHSGYHMDRLNNQQHQFILVEFLLSDYRY